MTGFVHALAVELGGTGVTANAVSPGSTRTAMLDESARLYGLEDAEAFAGQQPIERLLEPEEIAAPDRLAGEPAERAARPVATIRSTADFPSSGSSRT